MQNKLKNTLESRLKSYLRHLDQSYCLNQVSALLFRQIREFVLRKGKRLRPTLLLIGYLGFTQKVAPRLYKTALSIELLHDFMLVHDDIIDKSPTRRGKPSMHRMYNNYLRRFKKAKFSGQDLAIVAGDVMYAMAIDTFLSIKVDMRLKERGLRNLIRAAIYTGMGEFIELISGTKDIQKITKDDIYKIYDYKTAHYTFACPLSTGAILAGAGQQQVNRLHQYGIYLGRAFQIRDDILGIFGQEKRMGKSVLTDLQEAKKTILVWMAYHNASKKHKSVIRKVLAKAKVNQNDLLKVRRIILASGALDDAQKEILHLIKKAQALLQPLNMRPKYKSFLQNYSQKLLTA